MKRAGELFVGNVPASSGGVLVKRLQHFSVFRQERLKFVRSLCYPRHADIIRQKAAGKAGTREVQRETVT
jgi:hypothetical protein